MSWFDNLKKWFWGDLKPELQEDLGMAGEEPIKKTQPKVIVTTDEVLEEAVKKTLEKKPVAKKPVEKKPRKPRKKKESNAD